MLKSNIQKILCAFIFCSFFMMGNADPEQVTSGTVTQYNQEWRAIHLFAPWHSEMEMFKRTISEKLAPMGINTIVIEVNYKLAFESYPELREPGQNLTKEDARALAELCRKNNIRLIPLFNCFGHQSWAENNFPLIVKYPELDETPNIPKDNKTIYCRSWCPLHPKTNKIVFSLFDEIIEAFEADAFHVGMDEVFLIASEQCPRCKGKNPADIFAKAVNDNYNYLVRKKNLTMLMWGDRLLDMKKVGYGEWEASNNGTAPAIDMIPKDIIICDWHYEFQNEYPSITYLQEKGFRVLVTPWRNLKATKAFIDYAQKTRTDKMLGYLFTAWVGAQDICPVFLGETEGKKIDKMGIEAAETIKESMKFLKQSTQVKK